MSPPDPTAQSSDPDVSLGSLVARIRNGDTEAFGAVVHACESRLTNFCAALLRDRTAAEEVAQEAFIRAYRYFDSYDAEKPFYPWLAGIAFRLAQDSRRRRRSSEPVPDTECEPSAGPAGPLEELIRDEQSRSLWNQVCKLPAGERASVVLFYKQGLAVREVAAALGVTSGTVKTFLFRARRHLRQRLESLDRGEKR